MLINNKGTEYYSLENQTLLQEIARLDQCCVVKAIIDIDDVNIDFKPTLFDIAQEINSYDLIKLVMGRPGFKESLANVKNNECYMYTLLKKTNLPIVTMGLFSIPCFVMCEQYKMMIFNNII